MVGRFWDCGDNCWKYFAVHGTEGWYYDNPDEALREEYISLKLIKE